MYVSICTYLGIYPSPQEVRSLARPQHMATGFLLGESTHQESYDSSLTSAPQTHHSTYLGTHPNDHPNIIPP